MAGPRNLKNNHPDTLQSQLVTRIQLDYTVFSSGMRIRDIFFATDPAQLRKNRIRLRIRP